jgi:signal transduction histidine kinase
VRRPGAETLAGLTVFGLCVMVLAVVPFVADGSAYLVPVWAWWTAAVAYLAVTVWVMMQPPGAGQTMAGVAGQTTLAAFLLVGLPGMGWLSFLLVYGAALSTYLASWRVTAAVIAVNTSALAVGAVLAAQRQDEDLITAQTLLGVGFYLLLQVVSALVSTALQREQRLRTELSVAHTELAAATVLRDEVSRASERLRIARELHDLLGHQLAVLSLELESATHRSGTAQAEHVSRARTVARELLGDVRTTVGELRRRAPDLREALGAVADAVPYPRVEVSVADDVAADEEQTAALVRVAQEAATNSVRHAEAARVLRIDVSEVGDELTLVAQDDGFAAGTVTPGNGLRGIVERTEALGGAVRFDGTRGFRIEVALPRRVHS